MSLKRLFPTSVNKWGLLFGFLGVLVLGLRYLQLPFISKGWILMVIPPWVCDIAWGLIILGFLLQYFGSK